jgi:uncharacterized protein
MSAVGDTMSLENIVEKGALLDCYGALLTERQREYLDLYYNENLTLAEIAELRGISRQAVHDAMTRGEEQLLFFETKLGLAAAQKREARKVSALLSLIPEEQQKEARDILKETD